MNKKIDVLTIGDCCVDLIISGKDLVPEFDQVEKLVDQYTLEMGGSCTIFASQSAKLGLKTTVLGKVGNDAFGDKILRTLKESGVSIKYMKKMTSEKTGITIALLKNKSRALFTYIGTIDVITNSDINESLLNSTRHFHIGSYYLMKGIQPHYLEIARKLKRSGATISLDTNWDPEIAWNGNIWELFHYVDIFLPNENEALAITRQDNLKDAIKKLKLIIPIIVVKCGKKGAIAYTNEEKFEIPALNVEVVDTIGAGDNFNAGFIFGHLTNNSIKKSLKIASICGSLSTTKAGGIQGQPYFKEILKYL